MFTARKKRYRDQCPVEESFHNLRKKKWNGEEYFNWRLSLSYVKDLESSRLFFKVHLQVLTVEFFKICLPHLSITAHEIKLFSIAKFRVAHLEDTSLEDTFQPQSKYNLENFSEVRLNPYI